MDEVIQDMAERRMFAKTIIDSDAFLDMPLSAQALYFHLSMRADDEGFINNPKKIQRMAGASDDDLKLLIAKNFIIPFESGIVVIKHWRIHNYIRADRLVATKYQEERGQLEVKENGSYTLSEAIPELEAMDSDDKRKTAYKNSSLPYSFTYKIKRAFEGKICPVCGKTMTSAYKSAMPTIQHNLPISKGGTHELDNISVICESCNVSIKDNETEPLNNADVIEIWDRIIKAEQEKANWFQSPSSLWQATDRQVTDICPSNDSIGKDSIGKDSIGKVSNKRFTAPTVTEVQEYITEKGYSMNAEAFVDFYTSKGWKVGSQPMKDWKAAVRNWNRRDREDKRPSFNNFPQHEYNMDDLTKKAKRRT